MSRRPILGLWGPRTDDARRTKGDPPPTYAQLETTVATLTVTLKTQGDIIRSLRSQVDGLIVENTKLRTVVAEKTEYVETLALELAQARIVEANPAVRDGRVSADAMALELAEAGAEPKPTLREQLLRLGYLEVQPPVERDWAERHLGSGGER